MIFQHGIRWFCAPLSSDCEGILNISEPPGDQFTIGCQYQQLSAPFKGSSTAVSTTSSLGHAGALPTPAVLMAMWIPHLSIMSWLISMCCGSMVKDAASASALRLWASARDGPRTSKKGAKLALYHLESPLMLHQTLQEQGFGGNTVRLSCTAPMFQQTYMLLGVTSRDSMSLRNSLIWMVWQRQQVGLNMNLWAVCPRAWSAWLSVRPLIKALSKWPCLPV